MTDLTHPHLFLPDAPEALNYRNPSGGEKDYVLPPRPNKRTHADRLKAALDKVWSEARKDSDDRAGIKLPAQTGTYIEFEGVPGFDLHFLSLEARSSGIILLNSREIETADGSKVLRATIFVPFKKEKILLNKIEAYLHKTTKAGQPRNKKLIESIESVRRAVIESFWYDPTAMLPGENSPEWCEIWMRTDDTGGGVNATAVLRDFRSLCETLEIPVQPGEILFPERAVVVANVSHDGLEEILRSFDNIAEFRRAKEATAHWGEMENAEQARWVEDLSRRITVNGDTTSAVCVLDTGVNNGHPLLAPLMPDDVCHSVDAAWAHIDSHGHGTTMVGTAIFGERLPAYLQTAAPIVIPFVPESVKLIDAPGTYHQPRLYGERTQQAVSRAEIAAPDLNRTLCLAVTSTDGRDNGRPSSWSAALDTLTSGAEDGQQRLAIVAAGNVDEPEEWKSYPHANLTNAVHDPAQSWNSLTVGGVTFKDSLSDAALDATYSPVAPTGGLSPFSTTSLICERKWPNKPDIVVEGGNVGIDETNFVSEFDDYSMLSTNFQPHNALLTTNRATSAATGVVSEMAGRLWAAYPDAWPETIRGLLVHSARWPEALHRQFRYPGDTEKAHVEKLLRIAGYGAPNFDRAEQSARDSLTLISEQRIQPFEPGSGSSFRARDMHLYSLPWPIEALDELPEQTLLTLDVTLSYFVEPGPGEKGWRDKYRYRSHGLDFNVNKPTESMEEFAARINKEAQLDPDGDYGGSSLPWAIGRARSRGSVHRDWVQLTAQQIKECRHIAVMPRTGWWKERSHLNRAESEARYSLIVSLHAPELEIPVDIYTPIAERIAPEIVVPATPEE